jgi:hypothetical protein
MIYKSGTSNDDAGLQTSLRRAINAKWAVCTGPGFTPSHRSKTVSKLFALELLGLGLSEFPELRNH